VRVLCAGHVNWDVTLFVDRMPTPEAETRIERQYQSGGGSAANVAVVLADLGVASGILGSVGDDEHGLLARRELERAGVDVETLRVVPGDTAVKYLLVPADAEALVVGSEGANEAVEPADVDPPSVRRADHLHLTSQRPATAARLAELAVEAGVTVSFDPGRRVAERDYAGVYPHVDLLFVNEHERAAAGQAPPDATLVEKRGARGATARTSERTHEHAGYGIEPVDTAGAGDAFAGGFLAVWLGGGDVETALATANACGAVAASRGGARTRLDWSTVERVRDERVEDERV
jgi:ribokinase